MQLSKIKHINAIPQNPEEKKQSIYIINKRYIIPAAILEQNNLFITLK